MDYMGFSVDVPGYSPAIFCKSARSPIRRRFLVSWRRAPHPRQDPQGPHKRSPVHPKENRQFFLGHLGVEVELVTVQT